MCMHWDGNGNLTLVQGNVTTLPAGFLGTSGAGEVLVDATGKFLYGSRRPRHRLERPLHMRLVTAASTFIGSFSRPLTRRAAFSGRWSGWRPVRRSDRNVRATVPIRRMAPSVYQRPRPANERSGRWTADLDVGRFGSCCAASADYDNPPGLARRAAPRIRRSRQSNAGPTSVWRYPACIGKRWATTNGLSMRCCLN
jgi:hypothetical protein